MKKIILEIAKWIGAIAAIGGAALFFDGFRDDISDAVKDSKEEIMDTLIDLRGDLQEYQVTTYKYREAKADQTNKVLESIGVLNRNQRAIINKSTEQKEILEEIKNQQLINGIVEMNYIIPISPDYLIHETKKNFTQNLCHL